MKEEAKLDTNPEKDPLIDMIADLEQVVWKHQLACEKAELLNRAKKLEMSKHFLQLAKESLK